MPPSIFTPDLLAGRVALVTGGGSGIGLGISECLLRAGARLAIASRSEKRLTQAAAELGERHGTDVLTVSLDVRHPDAFRDAAAHVAAELGSLDILVNNAAGNFYAPSADLSPNAWRAVVEIDLFGSFYGCQAAFPLMREQGFGRIISTSMTLHYRGWPRMAHATAAKAGVDALTRTLALEWARHGITVNAVAPGPIPTEGVKKAFASPGGKTPDLFDVDAGDPANVQKEQVAAERAAAGERAAAAYATRYIPVGRLGTPEDVGNMVVYLASRAGDWITGAVFVVDGGESLAGPRVPGGS